jgi:hypothetical protein
LTELKSCFPLDSQTIISVKGDIAELTAGVKELDALKKELF